MAQQKKSGGMAKKIYRGVKKINCMEEKKIATKMAINRPNGPPKKTLKKALKLCDFRIEKAVEARKDIFTETPD